jgi:hypothetical protein
MISLTKDWLATSTGRKLSQSLRTYDFGQALHEIRHRDRINRTGGSTAESSRAKLSSATALIRPDALLITPWKVIQYHYSCHNDGAMGSHYHLGARINRHDPKKSTLGTVSQVPIPIYSLQVSSAKCHQYTPNSLAAKRWDIPGCEVTTYEVGNRNLEGLIWPKDVTSKAVLSRGSLDGPGDHQW